MMKSKIRIKRIFCASFHTNHLTPMGDKDIWYCHICGLEFEKQHIHHTDDTGPR